MSDHLLLIQNYQTATQFKRKILFKTVNYIVKKHKNHNM